jgi:SOS-response transcriptional repressor LexA
MASNITLSTQSALAKKSGVAQSTIGRILRGKNDPQSENLECIAKAFGLTHSALAALAEEAESGSVSARGRPPGKLPGCVPLISWVQAKRLTESVCLDHPADVTDWIECPRTPRGPRTVALKVSGESMEPDYQHGDLIYVDPGVAAVHGKDVVVFLSDGHDVLFRRLVVEGARGYLRPLNPIWPDPVIPLANTARILGVVVGKYADK